MTGEALGLPRLKQIQRLLPFRGGRCAASIAVRSSGVNAISAVAAFSRTCAISAAFGIDMTLPVRIPQAIATWAGVALCRFATACNADEPSSLFTWWPSGEYAIKGIF